MKCDQCDVSMRLNEQECSGNSCSYLYECEICRKVRLTSSRINTATGLAVEAVTNGHAGNTENSLLVAPPDSMASPESMALLESINRNMELPHVNLGNNAPDLQPAQRLPERHHGENHYELAYELAHQSSEPELL